METNKIYLESCLETMRRMPDEYIDLTVTSPPYDSLRVYKGYSFDFEPIAKELFRITKQGGVVVWVVGDATVKGSETGTSFKQALYFKEIGFNLHDTMIYYKINGIPLNHNRYEQKFEYMFVFSKGKPKTFNPLLKTNQPRTMSENEGYHNQPDGQKKKLSAKRKSNSIKGNVFQYKCGYMLTTKDKNAYRHPAMFPESLANDHILTWSNKGDLIYDPFMGSGTTAKAAHLLKRQWLGSEISPEYVEIANKRLEPYLNQLTLF